MRRSAPPPAPSFADRPPRRSPSTGARDGFTVSLETVTPILGGAHRARALDEVDIIRVPSVRGHLRFWWRALFAGTYNDAADLYSAEVKLWGGPGGGAKDPAVRSPVEVRVQVTSKGEVDYSDIHPQRTQGAYALFPARSKKRDGRIIEDAVPRRLRVRFALTITAPAKQLATIRDAARAWILFGGYGGRTRRGLGSLTVVDPGAASWIPRPDVPVRTELTRLFARDIFAGANSARQVPTLAGSALYMIGGQGDPTDAWLAAIDVLRDFRQGWTGGVGSRAREPAPAGDPARPSVSNWPEADKIRHLAARQLDNAPYSHPPRQGEVPVWPRAGFGLPIVGQFQRRGRREGASLHEPPDFTLKWLKWADGGIAELHERLASPLIVKALPLADGRFRAIALWLYRAWPHGDVVLTLTPPRQNAHARPEPVPDSAARFDALVAPAETPLFAPLAGQTTLQAAFLDWLSRKPHVVAEVPHRDGGGGSP